MARGHGKKIDVVHWTHFASSFLAQSAGTAAVTLNAAQHLPETLLRTRGEFTCWKDATGTPGQAGLISLGMIFVPEGTGTTVLWSPQSDGDAPWIWVDYFAVAYEEMVTDVISVQTLSGVRRVIDSKAMRHNRNQEVQMVIENTTVGTAISVNAVFAGRTLWGS